MFATVDNVVITLLVTILVMQTATQNKIGEEIPGEEIPLQRSDPEDALLNFTQLANKYIGACEEHEVITEDGYKLWLFRLPGNSSRPVLVLHGTAGSADDFIIRGETSLLVALNKAGYDVWAANWRGNRYSKRHVTLNPDTDKKFWDFGMEETALIDTASNVDYVLAHSGLKKIPVIGYSVGTTMFYALGAEKPEYNEKISLMISLAPICYTYNAVALSAMHAAVPIWGPLLGYMGINEINSTTLGMKAYQDLCEQAFHFLDRPVASSVCLETEWTLSPGFNPNEIEPAFTPIVIAHYPSSTSRKFLIHFSQIGKNRRLAKYDYGFVQNVLRYGTPIPPAYDLSKTTMKIALISGKNDLVSTLQDVEVLKTELPNQVAHIILEPQDFSHIDFMWSRDAYKILYPHIFNLLKNHT